MLPAHTLQPGPVPAPGATPWPLAPAGLQHLMLVEASAHRTLAAGLPRGEWLRRWRQAHTAAGVLVLPHASGSLSAAAPTAAPTTDRAPSVHYRLEASGLWAEPLAPLAARLAQVLPRWHVWALAAQAAQARPDHWAWGGAAPAELALGLSLASDAPAQWRLEAQWRQHTPLTQGPAPLHLLPGAPAPLPVWLSAPPSVGLRRGQSLSLELALAVEGSDEWPTLALTLPAGLSATWVQADGGVRLTLSASATAPLGVLRPALTAQVGANETKLNLTVVISAF